MTTKLVKEGFGAKANRQVRQLAKSYPRKGLGHLLRDTNRVNTGLRRDVSPRGAFGYGWESGDNEVDYWTPQGISGNGGGVQAVSWYRGESGSEKYEDGDPRTKLARWRLNPSTKRLARGGATQAWSTGFDQLQGVLTNRGRIFVSSTHQGGRLYHGKPRKKAQVDRWGYLPEGLYATGRRLWTATEGRYQRTVFGKTFRSLLRD